MRAAKWVLIVVGSLLLLLVAAVVVITAVVNPDRYRGNIESLVADQVGRPLVIEGHLQISWFPWIGIRTGPAHLGGPPHGGNLQSASEPPLIEWQSIVVAAKVLPLLKGQVVVDRIRLESPQIRLRRDAEGRGNWEGMGPSSGAGASGPKTSESRQAHLPASDAAASGARASDAATSRATHSGSTPGSAAQRVQIAGLEIRDGTVTYDDEVSGLQINLSNVGLDIGEWRAGKPVSIHTRFLAHGGFLPPAGVWIQVDTPAVDVRTAPLNVSAPELTMKVAEADIRGSLRLGQAANLGGVDSPQGREQQVDAAGSVTIQAPSVRKLAAQLGLNQTLPHDPTTLGPLELRTDWSYQDGVFAAKRLQIKLDEVTLQGWVEHSAVPQSAWRFELHGDRIDLDRYVNVDSTRKKSFELDMLKAINANGSLVFDEAQLADARLADVRMRFETTEAKAEAEKRE